MASVFLPQLPPAVQPVGRSRSSSRRRNERGSAGSARNTTTRSSSSNCPENQTLMSQSAVSSWTNRLSRELRRSRRPSPILPHPHRQHNHPHHHHGHRHHSSQCYIMDVGACCLFPSLAKCDCTAYAYLAMALFLFTVGTMITFFGFMDFAIQAELNAANAVTHAWLLGPGCLFAAFFVLIKTVLYLRRRRQLEELLCSRLQALQDAMRASYTNQHTPCPPPPSYEIALNMDAPGVSGERRGGNLLTRCSVSGTSLAALPSYEDALRLLQEQEDQSKEAPAESATLADEEDHENAGSHSKDSPTSPVLPASSEP